MICCQPVDVAAMQHDVEAERQAAFGHEPRGLEFARVRPRAGDGVAERGFVRLETDLDRIESRLAQLEQPLAIEPNRAGDEIAVEPRRARRDDEFRKVAPGQRLAAGKPEMQHAELRRLGENALPIRRGQFLAPPDSAPGSSNTGNAAGTGRSAPPAAHRAGNSLAGR